MRKTGQAVWLRRRVVDTLRAMERDSGRPLNVLKVDGGASANDLLMQFQSGVLGVEISRPELVETTALGAAFLAGLGTGVWKDQAEVTKTWREQKRFKPTTDRAAVAEHLKRWDAAVARPDAVRPGQPCCAIRAEMRSDLITRARGPRRGP